MSQESEILEKLDRIENLLVSLNKKEGTKNRLSHIKDGMSTLLLIKEFLCSANELFIKHWPYLAPFLHPVMKYIEKLFMGKQYFLT